MWNKPTEKELASLPALYATENIRLQDTVIHLHFFIGGCDWYAIEYDPQNQLFFGFVILNNDSLNAEWGYFSFKKLCDIKIGRIEIDRDLYFTPTRAKDIEKIKQAQNW